MSAALDVQLTDLLSQFRMGLAQLQARCVRQLLVIPGQPDLEDMKVMVQIYREAAQQADMLERQFMQTLLARLLVDRLQTPPPLAWPDNAGLSI